MARRVVGSNQYKSRAGVISIPNQGNLCDPWDQSVRLRCGDVWNTRCKAWVCAPRWSHGSHGMSPSALHNNMVRLSSDCPPDTLTQIAATGPWELRAEVAVHPRCPVDTIWQLAYDPRVQVRWGAASNGKCPPPLLERLAEDEDWSVRHGVASNTNAPAELLVRLLADPDPDVRRGVRFNNSLPPEYQALIRTQN